MATLGKAQSKAIQYLKEMFLYNHSYGDKDNYEIKEFKCEPFESQDKKSKWSVVIEVGMKNDEGTAAAIICRDRRHFFIGKNGGVEVLYSPTKKSNKPWRIMMGSNNLGWIGSRSINRKSNLRKWSWRILIVLFFMTILGISSKFDYDEQNHESSQPTQELTIWKVPTRTN